MLLSNKFQLVNVILVVTFTDDNINNCDEKQEDKSSLLCFVLEWL